MEKDRLIAFSDGVLAVVITIMVLELKAPREPSLAALAADAAPGFEGHSWLARTARSMRESGMSQTRATST